MKLSPYYEANSCLATEYISSNLYNPKVHYRVHKILPLVSNLGHMNLLHGILLL
jgi:hypothetical protein